MSLACMHAARVWVILVRARTAQARDPQGTLDTVRVLSLAHDGALKTFWVSGSVSEGVLQVTSCGQVQPVV